MSIVADIKQAKAELERHLSTHKCGETTKCQERSDLRQAWYGTAGLWAAEPDDDQRQREHFERNYKRPAA